VSDAAARGSCTRHTQHRSVGMEGEGVQRWTEGEKDGVCWTHLRRRREGEGERLCRLSSLSRSYAMGGRSKPYPSIRGRSRCFSRSSQFVDQ
jgi:hypothetical protein